MNCKQNLQEIVFSFFLDILVDRTNPCFQDAWFEFQRRYQSLIFKQVHYQMKRWRRAGDEDLMHEISALVMERLIANDFRVLKIFRERKEEGRFRKYLQVISTFMAIANLKRLKETKPFDDKTPTSFPEKLQLVPETHHAVVNRIREKFKNTNKSIFHLERDILIYTLRTAGLKSKDLENVPLFGMTDHNVDVIVDRIKEKFEK